MPAHRPRSNPTARVPHRPAPTVYPPMKEVGSHQMSSATSPTNSALHAAITRDGFAFVHGRAMRDLLAPYGALADWRVFADSWNQLELDTYMADGGRYRRRRHATYAAPPQAPIVRQPHQPHFQTVEYNPLHG